MVKKYQKVSECPDELQKYLNFYNLIEPNAVLEKIDEEDYLKRFKFSLDVPIEETKKLAVEENEKFFKEYFKDFKDDFKQAVLSKNESVLREKYKLGLVWTYLLTHTPINPSYYRFYEFFYNLRRDLQLIARFFAQLRVGENLLEDESLIKTKSGEIFTLPKFKVQLSRKETKGKINSNNILPIVDVDLDRIRLCEICKHIFWAKKTNAVTCGEKKCSDELGNKKRKEARRKVKEQEAQKKEEEKKKRQKWHNQNFSRKTKGGKN